jgi:hypothetical protein
MIATAVAATLAAGAYDFARDLALRGPRPAASAAERRAQARVERRFEAAGLRIGHNRFSVPGKGRSANVVGIRDVPADCLRVVMAHTDTVPPSPGADDNASGVGTLVSLGDALAAAEPAPRCDVWLIATGAEERIYTGRPDHLGALAVVRRLRRLHRDQDLVYGLSLDEVGRGRSFHLRSPASAPRQGVERALLRAARRTGVRVRWVRDESTGNSDHRELELAGLPAMKLGVPDEPVRHTAADTPDRLQRGAFRRALKLARALVLS